MTDQPQARAGKSATPSRPNAVLAIVCVLGFLVVPASAADWPMYQHNAARSGITSEALDLPLAESWVFQSRYAPQPAWGDPKPEPVEGILELRRNHFDDVFQPVAAGGAVYFGSSVDNKLYCLNAATGRIRWSFIAGGPIRLAPTVSDGRVYFGSDDGHAYCLDAADGSLAWQFHAAPTDQRVLGHGRMISLWPLRSGVLVDRGVAYLAAGIFPAEGVFLYALDAATGTLLWKNDTFGEEPQSRVSPQGYLLASASALYVPMGRVSPSAFDRKNGTFLYSSFFGKTVGGSYALLADDYVFTGTEEMVAYHGQSRDRFAAFAGEKLVVTSDAAYVATATELSALNRKTFPAASRKLEQLKAQKAAQERAQADRAALAEIDAQIAEAARQFAATTLWKLPTACHDSLILAGGTLFAGGANEVIAVSAASGKMLWSARVEGAAKGLAAAGGRLLVSTDKGLIYAFTPQGAPRHGKVAEPVGPTDASPSKLASLLQEAAKSVLDRTNIRRGYCLVAGCETGDLAIELAKRSELMIYAVDPDAAKVEALRRKVDRAGLYGARICVEQWPLDKIPYADYFANLIVSETAMATGRLEADPDAVLRMLKPLGGAAVTRLPQDGPADFAPLKAWFDESTIRDSLDVATDGPWAVAVRGPLAGAGSWTHLYGNAANSACGDDRLVKAPLGVLWFGQPGPGEMVNRHQRAAGPLSVDGRLFVQGENVLMAYDAYNGVKLWQRQLAGALRANASHDGGNLAANRRGFFVAIGDRCLRLDPATGQTIATFTTPREDGRRGRWAYVACTDDLVWGSRSQGGLSSDRVFAVDIESGKTVWEYRGKQIGHNSIAVAGGTVFLVDNNATAGQRAEAAERVRQRLAKLPETEPAAAQRTLAKPDVRLVMALDAATGKPRWQQSVDLAGASEGSLSAMVGDGVLVLFGVYLDGHYWKQFFAGEFDRRKVIALSAGDGELLWSKNIGYRVRPLIVGDTFHAEPWAFDLKTGEPKTRLHPVTGQVDQWQFARPGHHCGLPIGSPNCLFFRSNCFGYYDLVGDQGTMHFGAQRPGCWINFIPAGGLLLMPEASAGCMCAYPNMCSVAFKPVVENKAYSVYSAPGPLTPVKRLAVHFGAPGDRVDQNGQLWLAYPRPRGSLVLQFAINTAFYRGGAQVARSSNYTPIAGTEDPWLFATAAQGLRRCELPLLEPGDGAATYRVRLAFCDPVNDRPGQRVFDIKLQGKVVEKDFDIVAAAGGKDHAVLKEFSGIEVTDKLLVELVSKTADPLGSQAPILQAIEAVRDRVISLGCAVPDFLTSRLADQHNAQIRLANLRQQPFQGLLRVRAPQGFRVVPSEIPIAMAAGARHVASFSLAVGKETRAGNYPLSVELVRGDGTVEVARSARIEHLGNRARLVVDAIEDSSVHAAYPDANKGTAESMFVDGGASRMGDEAHALACLRFRFQIPGSPVRAVLRITNSSNPSRDAGRVCLAEGPWSEGAVNYRNRPAPGKELGRLGSVVENRIVECPLDLDLAGRNELSLVIDPTSSDGLDYLTRESGKSPQLVIEYEPTR